MSLRRDLNMPATNITNKCKGHARELALVANPDGSNIREGPVIHTKGIEVVSFTHHSACCGAQKFPTFFPALLAFSDHCESSGTLFPRCAFSVSKERR